MNNEENNIFENTDANDTKVEKNTNKSFNLMNELFEWFLTIFVAVAVAFIIKTFLFDIVVVDGNSMFPTLHHGDRMIITKIAYKPDMQDIIVLDSNYKSRNEYYSDKGDLNVIQKGLEYFQLPEGLKKRYYVKRIVALEGDTVDLIDNKVYVNGTQLDEDYYYTGNTFTYDVEFPFTVSKDHVFVMGDNRNYSKDSRSSSLGEVPQEAIAGKCSLRIWPFSAFGTFKH